MDALYEEKYLLVKQYVGLLNTIEEAFGHIIASLDQGNISGAEHLWEDVLMALMQIKQSNKVLADHFADQTGVLDQFFRIKYVVEKALMLQYKNHTTWEEEIGERIYPAFSEWSREITKLFRPSYIN